MASMSSASDPTRAVYVISVAAELAGVHAQTLRIYERKGLLAPARPPAATTLMEARREYRRDLVPLRQSVVPWLDPRRRR